MEIKQLWKVLGEFNYVTNHIMTIMKQTIDKPRDDTNRQLVECKKEMQNMNVQHRKE